MQEIIAASRKAKADGVVITWKEGEEKKQEFFSFTSLIDMHINALDLLDHPTLYRIEEHEHRIVATEAGCCTYT